MLKSYHSQTKYILIFALAPILVLGVLFGFLLRQENYFNTQGALLGAIGGAMFSLIILFYGLGHRVYLTDDEVVYSAV